LQTDFGIGSAKMLSEPRLKATIALRQVAGLADEAYNFRIADGRVILEASSSSGAFYAVQTLRQLVCREGGRLVLPDISIEDAPRFGWRALMIDPARHMWQLKDIQNYIEVMAQYKFNKLHLHLSDDQGWRLTVDKWPRLAEIASRRSETEGDGKPHGGCYNREQLKEIVAFAAARHVEIIPEIDVPGHNAALLAAYPEFACFPKPDFKVRTTPGVSLELLCPANPKLYELYADIFHELADIFPSRWVHLGGDEAPLNRWKECPACAQLREREKLESPQREMGWFFTRMTGLIAQEGKQPLFWYETDVAGYPANSVMFTWRMGKTPAVINLTRQNGWKLIASPGEYAYLDYPQEENGGALEKVYRFDPGYGLPPEKQAHILGAEGALWGEHVRDIDRANYMTWPRGWALAEAMWTPMAVRGWDRFKAKLASHKQRFDAQHRALGPLPFISDLTGLKK
jgi:hexosaminidase